MSSGEDRLASALEQALEPPWAVAGTSSVRLSWQMSEISDPDGSQDADFYLVGVIIDGGSSALLVDLIDTGIIQSLVVDGIDEGIVVTGSGRRAWNGSHLRRWMRSTRRGTIAASRARSSADQSS